MRTSTRILVLLSLILVTKTESLSDDNTKYRLQYDVDNLKYTVTMNFAKDVFTTNTFKAEAKISLRIKQNDELQIHLSQDYIKIEKVLFTNYELANDDYDINSVTDILTIHNLAAMGAQSGKVYEMIITYTGIISTTDTYGIYKRSYVDSTGDVKYLIATQFEPIYARRAFPCFDEPAFKATFDFQINVDPELNLTPLFNTPFNTTTPKMSTYLVAFVLANYTYTEGSDRSYKIWSRPDTEEYRTYAVTFGQKALNELEIYTGIKYKTNTVTKIDQVALPDFASGAMENWGLLTYSEKWLLQDNNEASVATTQSIATTITHELAHQWFGNLITCNWWSVTFLNEGFARFFEYFITHKVETTWDLDKQFVVAVMQPVLEIDGVKSSIALNSEANTNAEISNKFNKISYDKGSSIIRMVQYILGDVFFNTGIQKYVGSASLQFSTALPSNLWNVLQEFSSDANLPEDCTLEDAMKTWVEQPGYPLLNVKFDKSKSSIVVSQSRFLYSGKDDTKWYVPLNVLISNDEGISLDRKLWLSPDSELNVSVKKDAKWIILNNLQSGYYRVNYDKNLWALLSAALEKDNFDGIPELSRSQIVDDLFSLARASKATYSEVIPRLSFLRNDLSYYSWMPAFKGFNYINQKIPDGTKLKSKLQEHILQLIENLYSYAPLASKEDGHVFTLTKVLAGSWACGLGNDSCIAHAQSIFNEYKTNNAKPETNIRSVVYCNALRYSNDTTDYDFLWNIYTNSALANEKATILNALGCSSDESKLQELLSETIKDTEEAKIRYQDLLSAFAAVYSGSEKGVDITLDFLTTNYDEIVKKYPALNYKSGLIKGIAERLTTKSQVSKLQNIINAHDEFSGELKEAAEEALASANSNLNWITSHQSDLEKYYLGGAPRVGVPFILILFAFLSYLLI